MSEPVVQDRFQTRDEIVTFIEQQATAAVEKAVQESPKVERRVPWVTSGPVGRDSDGYSVLKAAAFALGYVGPDQAKEELQVHHQLRELYQTYGFVPHCGAQSFLVPIATNHLPAFDSKGARLRDEIRQKMTAQADRFDLDEANWIGRKLGIRTKALGTLSDLAGGSLVPLPMLGELIDLQRNMEAFANAGAQEIALPPNGRLQFPKLTGGSTAYWVGEGSSITDNDPTTGSLDLQAKKLGVFVKVNNELMRFASPSAEGLVRYDMARVAALKADLAMLEGTGGTQIKGLLTYSGITSHTASTVGTSGPYEPPGGRRQLSRREGRLPVPPDAHGRRRPASGAVRHQGCSFVADLQHADQRLRHQPDVHSARVFPGLDRRPARGHGVPRQRPRRHGPAKRPDVSPRHPAHRRGAEERGFVRSV
jgi:hypothetical protein